MDSKKIWVFKSVSDEDRSYRSIGGYDDELMTKYVYDNFVANHKQVKEGDYAVIVDKQEILGFAKIQSIVTAQTKKKRGRCPVCGATNFEARKNKLPVYRCNKGHEFDKIEEETVDATTFIADYGNSFIKPNENVSIYKLRPFYANSYNRNMSIQLLSPQFFAENFINVPHRLSNNYQEYLSPIQAEEIIKEPDLSEEYVPNSEDERNKINRQIKERRGQKKFRDELRIRYGNICMVTGCKLLDILEAAHIKPYRGEKDNHPSNGLLLRSDIHTLFDLDLIGIDPETLTIHIHESAIKNGYASYHLQSLKGCDLNRPNKEALQIRWKNFNENIV